MLTPGLTGKPEGGSDNKLSPTKQSAYERRVQRFSVPAMHYSRSVGSEKISHAHPSSSGAASAKYSPKLRWVAGQGASFIDFSGLLYRALELHPRTNYNVSLI